MNKSTLKSNELAELLSTISSGCIFLVINKGTVYLGQILESEFFDNYEKWRFYPENLFKLIDNIWVKDIRFPVEKYFLKIDENVVTEESDNFSWNVTVDIRYIIMPNSTDFAEASKKFTVLPAMKGS